MKIKELIEPTFPRILFIGFTTAVIALIVVAYPDLAASQHTLWTTSGDMEFGYLLLAFAVAIIYRDIGSLEVAPTAVPLLLLAGISALLVVTILASIKSIAVIALILAWALVVWTVLGHRILLILSLGTALLLMVTPIWYLGRPILQDLTVFFVTLMTEASGITAFIYGRYIELATGVLFVAGGCSGLKYFQSAICLALMASMLYSYSLRQSIIVLVLATSLAVVANWIRVFALVLLANALGVDHPQVADHDDLGWVVFFVMMIPFYVAVYRMQPAPQVGAA